MEELMKAARDARQYAYAPYSEFAVGAAVLGESGRIYTGCNIENASYGLSNCAERTAIFKAISEGERCLAALAVVADTPGPVSPCGACRQVILEFDIKRVILENLKGDRHITTAKELLPFGFEKSDFREDGEK